MRQCFSCKKRMAKEDNFHGRVLTEQMLIDGSSEPVVTGRLCRLCARKYGKIVDIRTFIYPANRLPRGRAVIPT